MGRCIVSGVAYLALGFGTVWLLVAAYLVWLGRRQTLLRRRLEELEGRAPGSGEELRK
jgi:CcmD family protein